MEPLNELEELISLTPHPGERFNDYYYTKKDKQILRELAEKKSEIASLESNNKKIKYWEALNDLEQVRPLIWINEIPWHEMNINDELTLRTSNNFTRVLETNLRRTIYRWNHMPADMVVEPIVPCYLEVNNTGFGISELVSVVKTDKESSIYSRGFIPQINNEEDIDKIKNPKVIFFKEDTEIKLEAMKDIFNGILKVEKRGYPGFWFSPWDELIRWWSIEKLLIDLIIRAELVHKTIKRLVDAYISQLDQYENLNLLTLNNCNYRIGSGGLGYTKDLPLKNYNTNKIRTKDLWGNSTAQIFSGVSPSMHYEFALMYEIQWMERFGLNYYGCCEPLDKKIEILKKIPNLRKISMSPWVDLEAGAKNIGRDYVFSYKPSPAIFVDTNWDTESIKKKLREDLKNIKGCNVEVLMKDISTVRYKPQRLWEWSNIAMDVVNDF